MAARFPITALIGATVDGLVKNARAAFAQVREDARKTGDEVDDQLGKKERPRGPRFKGARKIAKDTATALGGGIVATAAVAAKRVFEFEKQLDAIGVQAGKTEPEINALRDQINATSRATGLGRDEVAAAVDQLVNLEGGGASTAENIDLMGRAVKASGAAGADLAGVMFALNRAFFDGEAGPKKMEAALSSVLAVGKQGSIPLSEMSVVLQQVASQFDDVSASGTKGAADLAAALQAARPAFGSASEAGTGLRAAVGALIGKSKELKKFGVNVFNIGKDGSRELKPLREILDQIAASELAKRPDLLSKALGSKEALAFTNALIDNRDTWDQLAEAAEGSTAVQDDFLKRTRSQAGRAQKAMNDLNLTIDEAFTPERIEVFVNALSAVVKAASKVLGFLEGIGEAIGETAARAIVGDPEAAIERNLATNQLLKEQILSLGRRDKISRKQAESLRRRGVTDEGLLRAEAGQQIVKAARQERLIVGDKIDKRAVTESFGLGAQAVITGLERALALSAELPDRRTAVEVSQIGQAPRLPDAEPLAPLIRSLATNQQRIADAQEKTATQLATTARLLERSGTR